MELAVITAEKISVMFVMALIGMICYRIGLISGHTNEKLSDILLLLVSPLLIFTSYQQAFDPEKLNGLLTAFFMAAVSHAVAITITSFLVKKGKNGLGGRTDILDLLQLRFYGDSIGERTFRNRRRFLCDRLHNGVQRSGMDPRSHPDDRETGF